MSDWVYIFLAACASFLTIVVVQSNSAEELVRSSFSAKAANHFKLSIATGLLTLLVWLFVMFLFMGLTFLLLSTWFFYDLEFFFSIAGLLCTAATLDFVCRRYPTDYLKIFLFILFATTVAAIWKIERSSAVVPCENPSRISKMQSRLETMKLNMLVFPALRCSKKPTFAQSASRLFLQSEIFINENSTSEFNDDQLFAVLIHEVSHIERLDSYQILILSKILFLLVVLYLNSYAKKKRVAKLDASAQSLHLIPRLFFLLLVVACIELKFKERAEDLADRRTISAEIQADLISALRIVGNKVSRPDFLSRLTHKKHDERARNLRGSGLKEKE